VSVIKKIIDEYIEDILILSGLAILVGTTFFISIIAGFYTLGTTLFGLGVFFARHPKRK